MNKVFEKIEYNSDALDDAISMISHDEIACGLILRGKLISTVKGRGIRPLFELCQNNIEAAKDAVLADKIIGRAASFVAISFGMKAVFGETMSKGAVKLLAEHNIEAAYNVFTDEIRNRANTGICPMDSAILNVTDVDEAIMRLKEEIARLSRK